MDEEGERRRDKEREVKTKRTRKVIYEALATRKKRNKSREE